MAFTGSKTLSYKTPSAGASHLQLLASVTVQELTSLFQNLSATLSWPRLEYSLRYQKRPWRRTEAHGGVGALSPPVESRRSRRSAKDSRRSYGLNVTASAPRDCFNGRPPSKLGAPEGNPRQRPKGTIHPTQKWLD